MILPKLGLNFPKITLTDPLGCRTRSEGRLWDSHHFGLAKAEQTDDRQTPRGKKPFLEGKLAR